MKYSPLVNTLEPLLSDFNYCGGWYNTEHEQVDKKGWLARPYIDLSMCGSKVLYLSVPLQIPMSVKALIIFVL